MEQQALLVQITHLMWRFGSIRKIYQVSKGRFGEWCVVGCRGMRCFFFNDTATTEIYTLSLHDALPISGS